MLKDFIALDLETTGFSPQLDDIIEIGAWRFCDGLQVSKFSRRVKPTKHIPLKVQELTGITDSDLKDEESIEGVLPEFFDYCEDLPFVGHNIRFDYKFLLVKGDVFGLDFSYGGKRKCVDTLKAVRRYGNYESNSLEFLVEAMNLPKIGSLHSAMYDSYLSKLIYDRYPMAELEELGGISGKADCEETLSFE